MGLYLPKLFAYPSVPTLHPDAFTIVWANTPYASDSDGRHMSLNTGHRS